MNNVAKTVVKVIAGIVFTKCVYTVGQVVGGIKMLITIDKHVKAEKQKEQQ